MITVASRTFRSSPHRDAAETWAAIVTLLTRDHDTAARRELLAVSGLLTSVIADQVPKSRPIVVTCDGPRTRIYCTYDEDAVDGSDTNEEPLGFDPLSGDWHILVPCTKGDLHWVSTALKTHSARITTRGPDDDRVTSDTARVIDTGTLILDPKGFLNS